MKFPVSLEDFIAHQEVLIPRSLTPAERKVTAAWVPIFNNAHLSGLTPEDIAKIDSLIGRHTEDSDIRNFLGAAELWMLYANRKRQGVQ